MTVTLIIVGVATLLPMAAVWQTGASTQGTHAEAMIRAAIAGDAETIGSLLESRLDPVVMDDYGVTPLMAAAYAGNAEVISLLLQAGADVNSKSGPSGATSLNIGYGSFIEMRRHDGPRYEGDTALMSAVVAGHLDALNILLDAGADVNATDNMGRTALSVARMRNHREAMERLTESGADGGSAAPQTSSAGTQADTHDGSMESRLWSAVERGDVTEVQSSVDAGVDVNVEQTVNVGGFSADKLRELGLRGLTPVVLAALRGHADVTGTLVDHGADMDAMTVRAAAGEEVEFLGTALMAAARNEHVGVARLLIERGADVMASWKNMNALITAAYTGNLDMVALLVSAGAYKPTTLNGIKALQTAADRGHTEVAELLQTKFDEYLESGEAAEAFVNGFKDGLRKRAARNPDKPVNRRLLDRLDAMDGLGPIREVGDRFQDCRTCPEMIVLPTGEFEMGSPSHEKDRRDWEGPVHRVAIAEPIAMGLHEVTVAEFRRFVVDTDRAMGDSCWTFVSTNSFSERFVTVGFRVARELDTVAVSGKAVTSD